MSAEKYKMQLERIKQYLEAEGVIVDEVTMWQGGFHHEGTKYGLEIIARTKKNGIEESYCVPRHLIKQSDILEPLRVLKLENKISTHIGID